MNDIDEIQTTDEIPCEHDLLTERLNQWTGNSVQDLPWDALYPFPESFDACSSLRNTVPVDYQGTVRGPVLPTSETNSLAASRVSMSILAIDKMGQALLRKRTTFYYEDVDADEHLVLAKEVAFKQMDRLRAEASSPTQYFIKAQLRTDEIIVFRASTRDFQASLRLPEVAEDGLQAVYISPVISGRIAGQLGWNSALFELAWEMAERDMDDYVARLIGDGVESGFETLLKMAAGTPNLEIAELTRITQDGDAGYQPNLERGEVVLRIAELPLGPWVELLDVMDPNIAASPRP